MNTTALRVLGMAVALLGVSLLYAAGADRSDGTRVRCLKSAEAAVARAFEYTGFTEIKDVTGSRAREIAQMITARDSTTPFLSDSIDGRRAWIVKLEDVILDCQYTIREVAEQNPKDFEVYIDSVTGQLLGVVVRFGGYDPDLLPVPSAAYSETQLREAGEMYHGLPDQPPVLSLFDVLNTLKRPAALAREIIVNYVVYSRRRVESQPAWAIQLRGFPPDSRNAENTAACFRNYWRYVIGAVDGAKLFSGNSPHPEVPEQYQNTE